METCRLSAAYNAGRVRSLVLVGREGEKQKVCNHLKSMLRLFILRMLYGVGVCVYFKAQSHFYPLRLPLTPSPYPFKTRGKGKG